MNYLKQDNFFCAQGWMVNTFQLKGQELIVFSIIFGFSQTENTRFTAPLSYLQDWTLLSKNSLIEILKKLIDMNLIIKYELVENHIKKCEYAANIEYIQNVLKGNTQVDEINDTTVQETWTGHPNNLDGVSKKLGRYRPRNLDNIYNIINNKNKIINNTKFSISNQKNSEDIFNKTLQDKQKEIKEDKKKIKNKVQQKLLEGSSDIDSLVTDKMSDLNTDEVQQNRAAAVDRAAQKQLSAQKQLLLNTKKARIKEASEIFDNSEILQLLDSYLEMYQTKYNVMSVVSWKNILEEIQQYKNNPEQLKYYIKESTTRSYRKIYPVTINSNDNTVFHTVDKKALHELTEEERQEFEESLAKDENGEYLVF